MVIHFGDLVTPRCYFFLQLVNGDSWGSFCLSYSHPHCVLNQSRLVPVLIDLHFLIIALMIDMGIFRQAIFIFIS